MVNAKNIELNDNNSGENYENKRITPLQSKFVIRIKQ